MIVANKLRANLFSCHNLSREISEKCFIASLLKVAANQQPTVYNINVNVLRFKIFKGTQKYDRFHYMHGSKELELLSQASRTSPGHNNQYNKKKITRRAQASTLSPRIVTYTCNIVHIPFKAVGKNPEHHHLMSSSLEHTKCTHLPTNEVVGM